MEEKSEIPLASSDDLKNDLSKMTKERDQALEQVRRYESELIRVRGLADDLALALAKSVLTVPKS